MRGLRFAIVVAAAIGVLAHFALYVDSLGWDEFVQQYKRNPAFLSAFGTMFFLGWFAMPYVVLGIGQLALKSLLLLGVLLVAIGGLIGLDVWWYLSGNSKDWYVILSPLVLLAIAGVCLLLVLLFQSRDRPIYTPNPTVESDARKSGARGSL